MEYIIISLIGEKIKEIDLKIPSNITARELLESILSIYDIQRESTMKIHANPPGRIISEDEILAESGVYSGAIITII